MSVSLSSNSKILIIRLSSIGDIVLCTPVIRCIKLQTNCEIHFLVKEKFQEVLNNNPHIDKHYTLEDKELKKSLVHEQYDLIIDLQKNFRTFTIKSWLSVPSLSFHKANIAKWLLIKTKKGGHRIRHLVMRYFETLEQLSVSNDGKGLDYFYDKNVELPDLCKEYVALVIGAAHFTKQIPVELCNRIVLQSKGQVVLLGGKNEISKAELVQKNTVNCLNLVGQTTLNQSAKILDNASVVVTGDTGLMHIAAALKKPIVSIWGSTVPEFGMYPYYGQEQIPEYKIEDKALSCRPCTKIGLGACPKGHFDCMTKLSANDIILRTNELKMRN